MVRTQIQLTSSQAKALRQLSASTGESMAELIRQGVDLVVAAKRSGVRDDRIE